MSASTLDNQVHPLVATAARETLVCFYTVPRMGQVRLSDGGGPFGFDITTALQADYLIGAYGCDGIVETGCFFGDTTEYLGRRYPHLPVRTCDLNPEHTKVAAFRTKTLRNVEIVTGDSAQLLPQLLEGMRRPLVYLDAHWGPQWPLAAELTAIVDGLVIIDDFDIGHPRFGFDVYDEIVCGPALVAGVLPGLQRMWAVNPYAEYPLPCLQTGRRAGRGVLPFGAFGEVPLLSSPMYTQISLKPEIVMPDWDRIAAGGER